MITKILHPTDYTESSRPALNQALELAEQCKAELVLLHVVSSLGPEDLSYGESHSASQPEAYRKQLFDELRHILPAEAHVQADLVLSEEDVVTAILRTQQEMMCDLIVIGTHGVRRWFSGGLADEVVRKATCPVLVVKMGNAKSRLPEFGPTDLHPGHLVKLKDKDHSYE